MSTKYRCSKNPDHSSNFLANNAKVIQEWLCNEDGEYMHTVTECVDILHSPEELKLVCRECGSDAEAYEDEDEPDAREIGYRRLYGWMPHPSQIRGFDRYENHSDFVVAGGHTPQSSDERFCVSFSKIHIGDREIDDVDGAHNATTAMHFAWLTFEDGWRAFVWDKKEKVGWSYEHVGPQWEESFDTSDGDTPSDTRAVAKAGTHASTKTVEVYDDTRLEVVPDVVDALREQDWSGWSIGDQGTLVLHGKAGDAIARIDDETKDSGNRIFRVTIHPGTLRVKSTHDKSLADAIAWCEDNCDI